MRTTVTDPITKAATSANRTSDQEFLGQMLGTRRSSVSVAASILQKAGMITYTRGNVTIVNKSKLADAACDCYQMIQEQEHNWQTETQ
jgi:hypothetical protein